MNESTTPRWFKAIVGTIGVVVVALTAIGLYTIVPTIDAIDSPAYFVSMIVFGLAVIAVAFVVTRLGQRATPSNQGPDQTTASR